MAQTSRGTAGLEQGWARGHPRHPQPSPPPRPRNDAAIPSGTRLHGDHLHATTEHLSCYTPARRNRRGAGVQGHRRGPINLLESKPRALHRAKGAGKKSPRPSSAPGNLGKDRERGNSASPRGSSEKRWDGGSPLAPASLPPALHPPARSHKYDYHSN